MKVFISWSGKRSKETADMLCTWIRQVVQSAETWISSDIEKGTRWNEKVNKELEDTKVGIICLNRENLTSEWILFEAGALSKTSDAHVCTFLLDINPTDIKPPLGQFQHTLFSKEDIRKLIHTINNKIISQKEKTISEKDIDEIFENNWHRLEEKLNEIKNQDTKTLEPTRTDRELLEEILQTVRGQNSLKPIIVSDTFYHDKQNFAEEFLKGRGKNTFFSYPDYTDEKRKKSNKNSWESIQFFLDDLTEKAQKDDENKDESDLRKEIHNYLKEQGKKNDENNNVILGKK